MRTPVIEKTMAALEKNGITAYFVETRGEARTLALSLLHDGDCIGLGGSATLKECGMMEALHDTRFHLLDRHQPGLTAEQIHALYVHSFSADAFLCSTNAVTEQGELYNVDGTGNRVAAMTFGPRSVILLVGVNKIVPDLAAACERVRAVAAPLNTRRLSCQTPCEKTGHCICANGEDIGRGCLSPKRICCTTVVFGKQRISGRIKVILINETLGF